MKRSELEEYLGKKVTITLFDDSVYTGYLFKTGEYLDKKHITIFSDPIANHRKNYYFISKLKTPVDIDSCYFRCSHVTKIKEIYPLRTVFKD